MVAVGVADDRPSWVDSGRRIGDTDEPRPVVDAVRVGVNNGAVDLHLDDAEHRPLRVELDDRERLAPAPAREVTAPLLGRPDRARARPREPTAGRLVEQLGRGGRGSASVHVCVGDDGTTDGSQPAHDSTVRQRARSAADTHG